MNKKRLGTLGLASLLVISGVSNSKLNIKDFIKESPETYVESIATIKKDLNVNQIISNDSKDLELGNSIAKTDYINLIEKQPVYNPVVYSKDTNKVSESKYNVDTNKNTVDKKEDIELSTTNKKDNEEVQNVNEENKTNNKNDISTNLEVSLDKSNNDDLILNESDKEIIAPTIETDDSTVIELPVKGYTTKNLNVRSSGKIDKNNIIGLLPIGTKVSGIESNGWVKIEFKGKTAYISYDYISNTKPKIEIEQPEIKIEGWLTENLNLREGKGTNTKIITVIPKGTKISGIESDGWVKITYNSKTGYISKSYVSDKEIKPEVPKTEIQNQNNEDKSSNAVINSIVTDAHNLLGSKYVYASASPSKGFDCSGLVYYLYKTHAGITLNRTSRDQAQNGYAVSRNNLKPGDLLFFATSGGNRISHVGLYVGSGKMIHASTPSTGVIMTDINTNYYINNYVTARRILD